MIFTALELQNFGVYKHEIIELEPPSAEKPIIIFGGLNGAGKTTLLEAIQLCLYGKRVQTAKREGLSYEEYLRRCIHHGASERDGANVRLTFLLREFGEECRLSVSRDWHMAGSGIKETLQVWKDGEVDDRLTQQWDEYIDGILPVGVSHLFFFDGEQIERFADLTNSDELLRIAIYALLGLDLIQRLTVDLKVLEKRNNFVRSPMGHIETKYSRPACTPRIAGKTYSEVSTMLSLFLNPIKLTVVASVRLITCIVCF